jgi:hypothetical protein
MEVLDGSTKVLLECGKVLLECEKVLLESTMTKVLMKSTVTKVLLESMAMVVLLEYTVTVVLLPSTTVAPDRRADTAQIYVYWNENYIVVSFSNVAPVVAVSLRENA